MRLTSFGMFAIMRETTTKIWDWRNILTGIIRLVMIMQEKRSLLGENIFHFLIHTVVIGDIKGIRKEKNLGRKTNQKLHSLPYARIYMQLEYKLKMKGIRLIRQEESYSSQCPPQSEEVSCIYAEKRNRKKRGIYIVDTVTYNADAVGAYNILRKYHAVSGKEIDMPVTGLSSTKTIKVAVYPTWVAVRVSWTHP